MKAAAVLCILLFVFQQPSGCDQQSAPPQKPPKPIPYQRFVPIQRGDVVGVPWSGAFALDTKTGKLCLTYEADFGNGIWNTLPLCSDLLKQFPD
jgi:hypothetical protein